MTDSNAKFPVFWTRLFDAFNQWFRKTQPPCIFPEGKDDPFILDLPPKEVTKIMRQLLVKCREMENPPGE